MTGRWEAYDAWNEAIAACVFPELETPAPVYLDIEEDVLAALGDALGCQSSEVPSQLAIAVRPTLALDQGPHFVFRGHHTRLRDWRTAARRSVGSIEPPPVLALLTVLSLAAESMGRSDGMADNNYYGRLAQNLGVPEHQQKLSMAYMRVAESFWGSLNWWLEREGGRRGLPTAFALGKRYVGLPLSQALLRRSDRERLVGFFQTYGFPPGSQVSPEDLEPLLTDWIRRPAKPASTTMEGLWGNAQARPRVAQMAAVALAAWDGTVPASRAGDRAVATSRALLSLELGRFPKKRFKLGLLIHAPDPLQPRLATILSRASSVEVALEPAGAGALSLGTEVELDVKSLLEGAFRMTDSLTSQEIARRPRRAVGFKQEPLSQKWVEIDQVLLTDEIRIVVHDALLPRLREVLERVARPGWQELAPGFPGVPQGWSVIRDVEVMGHPGDLVPSQTFDDLNFLIPLTSRQVRIDGGFSLPGSATRKWHVEGRPEVRAVSDAPGGVTVRLQKTVEADDGSTQEECALEVFSADGLLVIDLAETDLGVGSYRIDLVEGDATVSSVHFQLASGDFPDLANWSRLEPVEYDLTQTLGFLGVTGQSVRRQDSHASSDRATACPPIAWWDTVKRATNTRKSESVALPDPASCVHTGRHYEELPTPDLDKRGRPIQKYVEGTCKYCGLVRRYSTNYYRNRAMRKRRLEREDVAAPEPQRDLSALRPVRGESGHDWNRFLDALYHVGGGSWASFERVAMQVEPTGIFVDHAARLLESLGHINIRRDPTSIRPIAWEIGSTTFDTSTPERATLTGYWPATLTDQALDVLEDVGVHPLVLENENGPQTWAVQGADPSNLGRWAEITNRGPEILGSLPAISEIVAALPRIPVPLMGSITRFDPHTAAWTASENLMSVGGYRVRQFGTLDLVRGAEDLANETAARSTVQLSKHAAAFLTGSPPMLAYDKKAHTLRVPLGADLPGLIGRAVMAFSGLEPTVEGRSLCYPEVPEWAASSLYQSFSS